MLIQIKVINIFCVPILASIKKSYLVFSRSDKLSYCLSVTQPNIATSLIEKRTNEYVGRSIFSSPEHEVLMVSYWDSAVSVVRRASSTFYLVYALEATVLVGYS